MDAFGDSLRAQPIRLREDNIQADRGGVVAKQLFDQGGDDGPVTEAVN